MSRLFLFMQVCLLVAGCTSVTSAELNGYEALSDWESLARFKPGTVAGLASSYDRSGGNLDINYYESPSEFLDGDPVPLSYTQDPVTVLTIDGPGIVTRFWMPHYTSNSAFKVRMYIDGASQPAIDTNSDDLLAGQFGYMDAPLVSTILGGQVSYEPIAFAESLRIESQNFEFPASGWSKRHYYQYDYRKLPVGTEITSYTGTLTAEQQVARAAVVGMIDTVGQNPAGNSVTSTVALTDPTSIGPGDTLTLSNLTGGGLIRRLNIKMDAATDTQLDGLRLRVRYDGKAENAIDVPVSHFFGAGHERVAYKSLPLGTDSPEGFYSYWPMPFHKGVVVELYNSTALPININSAAIEYESGPVPADSLYFHAVHNEELTTAGQDYHMMLNVEGAGHYVGNLLYVQPNGTSKNILEGDEVITVDGVLTHHGTGLEDAYNGGYYYNHVGPVVQTDDGDIAYPESGIRPYYGLLHMDAPYFGDAFLRTDQYRWMIGDYVPFDEDIEVKIENYGGTNALFGSTLFYYLMPDLPGDVNGDGWVAGDDLSTVITYWGQSGLGREYGDLNDNGIVDGPDYSEVLSYWGTGVPPEPPPEPVPEPASLALLLAGGLILLRPRPSAEAFMIRKNPNRLHPKSIQPRG